MSKKNIKVFIIIEFTAGTSEHSSLFLLNLKKKVFLFVVFFTLRKGAEQLLVSENESLIRGSMINYYYFNYWTFKSIQI